MFRLYVVGYVICTINIIAKLLLFSYFFLTCCSIYDWLTAYVSWTVVTLAYVLREYREIWTCVAASSSLRCDRHFFTMSWRGKSYTLWYGMARVFHGQVRERHIRFNVECNVGCWIHLHERSTTSYFPLADDIPIGGGRSYILRVPYAGHVNIFIRLIRLVPRSSDIVIRSSYAAILRRRFVVRSWMRFVSRPTSFSLRVISYACESSLLSDYLKVHFYTNWLCLYVCVVDCWLRLFLFIFLFLSFP